MPPRNLHIASNLTLPPDTVTSTLIVYGGKGMGKSVFGSVLAEELAASNHRFAILDPMGNWWGLRYRGDGKGAGVELLILGGRHGDIPILPGAGGVVADLVVDEDVNVLVDIHSHADGKTWSRANRIQFVRDYINRLYERQGEKRRPLMQIIDECARFCPQTIRANEANVAECAGAIAQITEEGRNEGIGVTLITQRSARLNKDVAELADCMVAFRTVGPNSVAAITDWLGEHVPKERHKSITEELRKLPRGTALVVSPGWLEYEGFAAIRMRETFDSTATPKAGQERRAPGKGAIPDLGRYQQRMVETIEKAKQDDPKVLRAEVARLQRELTKAQGRPAPRGTPAAAPPDPKAVERAVERASAKVARDFGHAVQPVLAKARRAMLGAINRLRTEVESLEAGLPAETQEFKIDLALPPSTTAVSKPSVDSRPVPPKPHPRFTTRNQESNEAGLGAERKVLRALAQRHPLRVTQRQLATLAGLAPSGGTYSTYFSRLRTAGYLEEQNGFLTCSPEGLAAAGVTPAMPETSEEILAMWRGNVGAARKLLDVLADHYPHPISKQDLAEQTNLAHGAGTFTTYLSRLRSNGLIEETRDGLRLAAFLFGEADGANA